MYIRKILYSVIEFILIFGVGVLCSLFNVCYILGVVLIILIGSIIPIIQYKLNKNNYNSRENVINKCDIGNNYKMNEKNLNINIDRYNTNIKNKPKVRVRKKI